MSTGHAPSADEADLDRILGDDAVFMLDEVSRKLHLSVPTLYRGMQLGIIPYVKIASRRALTRATMKRLLTEGVPPIAGKLTALT
jgi:hypothetical protein